MDSGIGATLRHLRTLAAVRSAQAQSDGELLKRFVETHDEAAFTALVERHGPLVLRVCQRILGHASDHTVREETPPVRVLAIEKR